MSVDDLAALIADHGELYEPDWYHGCDCGYRCSADQYPNHLASILNPSVQRWLDEAWMAGYREGYESPDMPSDYRPTSPYHPDSDGVDD